MKYFLTFLLISFSFTSFAESVNQSKASGRCKRFLKKLVIVSEIIVAGVPAWEVRFLSCSIGCRNPNDENSKSIVDEFGKALLSKGGIVIAPTRNILFRELDWPNLNKHRPKNAIDIPESVTVATGLGTFGMALRIAPEVIRNYSDSRLVYRVIKIPPK